MTVLNFANQGRLHEVFLMLFRGKLFLYFLVFLSFVIAYVCNSY